MNQQDNLAPAARADREEFPWHLGVFDAHCHPTDTVASLPSLSTMRASALTIMATRSHNQPLVADVAMSHGIVSPEDLLLPGCKVVPSFGWHPWFAHQIYDDTATNGHSPNFDNYYTKSSHYSSLLNPVPWDRSYYNAMPTPIYLSVFLDDLRRHLEAFPHAIVGEIGIDRAFRLPLSAVHHDPDPHGSRFPTTSEIRIFSPYSVRMSHQLIVLKAQLRLAGAMGRAVSVHDVQAHGLLYDTISALWSGHERRVPSRRERRMEAFSAEMSDTSDEADGAEDGPSTNAVVRPNAPKPFPPRICLHSYTGSRETLTQWMHPSVPSEVFVSFSVNINLRYPGDKERLADILRAVPDHRVLVESDLHTAGEETDRALEDMYRLVCEIKGWSLQEGVTIIGNNFRRFIFG